MAGQREFPATAEGLLDILKCLRAPDGCPWDRKQTLRSLTEHFANEAAELIDAIDENDNAHIAEELGDVQMNLVFMAAVAEEEGRFTFEDAMRLINEKMIRRHPHVFGDLHAENAEEVKAIWQTIKAKEKGHNKISDSALGKLQPSLSALRTAQTIQERASKVNFDWPDISGVLAKVREETDEVAEALAAADDAKIHEEIGDLLFAVVNLARFRKQPAEALLRAACAKFQRRFQALEAMLAAENLRMESLSAEELDRYYCKVKEQES